MSDPLSASAALGGALSAAGFLGELAGLGDVLSSDRAEQATQNLGDAVDSMVRGASQLGKIPNVLEPLSAFVDLLKPVSTYFEMITAQLEKELVPALKLGYEVFVGTGKWMSEIISWIFDLPGNFAALMDRGSAIASGERPLFGSGGGNRTSVGTPGNIERLQGGGYVKRSGLAVVDRDEHVTPDSRLGRHFSRLERALRAQTVQLSEELARDRARRWPGE